LVESLIHEEASGTSMVGFRTFNVTTQVVAA
jgi:hypothetical protein